jgi:hypothetical protein
VNRDYARALGSIRDETIRREVAGVLASADRIRRHAPMWLGPEATEALWLAFVAVLDDDNRADRFTPAARRVLASLAAERTAEVGALLDLHGLLTGEADTEDADGPTGPQKQP